jgi:oxaloacetate decarboxylase alpha subunit
MISNLRSQLQAMRIEDRLDEILAETAAVRRDLGYPILVSPFAQYVVTQATLNVIGKERYKTIPDEVRRYALGYYGELAAPVEPNLFDRIAAGERVVRERPGDLLPPTLERVRRERGPFDSDDDLLLAVFYGDEQYAPLKAAGPIAQEYPIGKTPLLTLIKALSQHKDITSFRLVKQ